MSPLNSFFVILNPNPTITFQVSPFQLICPYDTVLLTSTLSHPNFSWLGDGIIWTSSLGDSILVNQQGFYSFQGTLTDPITGCSFSENNSTSVLWKTPPYIVSDPSHAFVCPDQSVNLFLPTGFLSYQWIGPDGDSLSITNICVGEDAGFYYCHLVDLQGCPLTTTPFELKEYMTPSVLIEPQQHICNNETITISVVYEGPTTIIWSNTSQNVDQIQVNQPGQYSVTVTQCGQTQIHPITIQSGNFQSQLIASQTNLCYQDVAILQTNTLGDATYLE